MTTSRLRNVLLAAFAALLLAGCGGGNDSGGDVASREGEISPDAAAYQGGYELCAADTIDNLAVIYGVAATKEAISTAIGEQVGGGGSDADRANGKAGCLKALNEK
jgi:hypothetical protein